MKISRIVAIGTALSAALALSACSGGTTAGNMASSAAGASGAPITLAGIAFNAQDPYWVTLMCGATKEAKAQGATIKWRAGNTTSVTDQQAAFQAVQLEKPSALVLASFQPSTFSTQISTLMGQGTPVIGVNGTITPATEYQLIRSNNDNSAFADQVAKDLGTGSGTIGVLGGAPGLPDIVDRWQPVVKAVQAANPNLKVLPTQYDDFDRNKASQAASALIVAHPDLKAIYSVSGPEGEGVAAAVQQAGKVGKIKVYSYDATPGEVTALKSGAITALLAQPAGVQGSEAVKAAVAAVKAGSPGKAITKSSDFEKLIDLKVLTKDNINDPSTSGYQYSATCDA